MEADEDEALTAARLADKILQKNDEQLDQDEQD